jgi:hypothetical protein
MHLGSPMQQQQQAPNRRRQRPPPTATRRPKQRSQRTTRATLKGRSCSHNNSGADHDQSKVCWDKVDWYSLTGFVRRYGGVSFRETLSTNGSRLLVQSLFSLAMRYRGGKTPSPRHQGWAEGADLSAVSTDCGHGSKLNNAGANETGTSQRRWCKHCNDLSVALKVRCLLSGWATVSSE